MGLRADDLQEPLQPMVEIRDLTKSYGGGALYRVLPKARKAAEEALRLDDTLAEAHASMGLVLNAEHKYEEAEKHYQRAIDINPNYTASYHRSAMNLSDMRRYQDSIRRAQQCLDLDPNSPLTAANMALTYRRLGNYPKAKSALLRVLNTEWSKELEESWGSGGSLWDMKWRAAGYLKDFATQFEDPEGIAIAEAYMSK